MTYHDYKAQLESQGWACWARYMGTGEETACEMNHSGCSYILTVEDKPDGVVASATITLPGFIQPVTTGKFGSPWSNKAFFTQVQRLEKIKRLVGDQLK